MIDEYYTTEFSVSRPTWDIDEYYNQFSEESVVGSFRGQLQQASSPLVQSLGLSFSQAFTVWCAIDTDVLDGDRLTVDEGNTVTSYVVKSVQKNNLGANRHLELLVELNDNVVAS